MFPEFRAQTAKGRNSKHWYINSLEELLIKKCSKYKSFPISQSIINTSRVTFAQETCCTYCHWKDRSFIFQQHALVTPINSFENSSSFYFFIMECIDIIFEHSAVEGMELLCCLTKSFYYVLWPTHFIMLLD